MDLLYITDNMLHISIISVSRDYFTFLRTAAIFKYFDFPCPASLDFFGWEVWLFPPNPTFCFSSNTLNILHIDQQLMWLFITTYKDALSCRVTVLARAIHACIIRVNSIQYESTVIWVYKRLVCLCQDLNPWPLG